ncbi:hypothetical protein KNE206_24440 [Kitasatospora sp. NE20-6]
MLENPVSAGSPVLDAYGRHVDGLFTYCLSVLCEHDAAVAAVGEVRDLALRHGDRLADAGMRRAWLYALARHCCLRRLENGAPPGMVSGAADGTTRAGGTGDGTGARGTGGGTAAGPAADPSGTPARPWTTPGSPRAAVPAGSAVLAQRREELSRLAWPEAAGTGPEQREALELAVRHRLTPGEVAAVLGMSAPAAAGLLAAAGEEVGRTRTALLVLGVGSCPELAHLGGVGAESWRGWVLGPALRRELVQHVVECPTCRGTADRVGGTLEHGLDGLPGLPLVSAPVTVRVGTTPSQVPEGAAGAAFLAGAAAGRRLAAAGGRPPVRFDQRGFPRHRAAGGGRPLVRQRVVTAGVLAAVLTAPVVALWAAHRSGEGVGSAAPVSSVRVSTPPAGAGAADAPGAGGADTAGPVEGLQLAGASAEETLLPVVEGAAVPVPSHGAGPLTGAEVAPVPVGRPAPAPGLLTVEASEWENRTVITLTNSGGTTIGWHAVVGADWLRLSRDEGTLEPGRRITLTVTVDEARVPAGHWTARITLPPSEAVVTLEGGPVQRGGRPGDPQDGTGGPSGPAGPGSGPSRGTDPAPGGTPTRSPDPSPDPGPGGTGTGDPGSGDPGSGPSDPGHGDDPSPGQGGHPSAPPATGDDRAGRGDGSTGGGPAGGPATP